MSDSIENPETAEDNQESTGNDWLRAAALGLSALGLAACEDEKPPPEPSPGGEGTVDAEHCGCMGGGSPGGGSPGGGSPAPSPAPPPAGGGTAPPGTGTPAPPGTGTPAPPDTGTPAPPDTGTPAPPDTGTPPPDAATPPAGGRSFGFLGPDTAAVSVVGMMMDARTQTFSDGSAIRVWGFADGAGNGFNGDRVVPAPVIEVTEGQPCAVTLNSTMPHTIHLHGLDVDQANDGFPSTSGFVGMAPMMGNFGRVQGAVSLGTRFTYRFTAPHAGTYSYHCHVDTVLHMEMGMSGTIIVRPPDGATNQAWTGGPTFHRETVWQLHTFDSQWHGASVSGAATVRYQPDYFLLNGRDTNDALGDPTCRIDAAVGETVLIRAVNLGYQPADILLGGLVFEVIASDGRPLARPLATRRQRIAPGERYDLLFTPANPVDVMATIRYLDIRGRNLLGMVQTNVSAS